VLKRRWLRSGSLTEPERPAPLWPECFTFSAADPPPPSPAFWT
jgi:hypothetical protein